MIAKFDPVRSDLLRDCTAFRRSTGNLDCNIHPEPGVTEEILRFQAKKLKCSLWKGAFSIHKSAGQIRFLVCRVFETSGPLHYPRLQRLVKEAKSCDDHAKRDIYGTQVPSYYNTLIVRLERVLPGLN